MSLVGALEIKQIPQEPETTEARHSGDISGRKLNEYEFSVTKTDPDEDFLYFWMENHKGA